MLPLPVSRAATAGTGSFLRRRRSAGNSAGLVGVMQATEAIKLILGKGEPLIGRLLLIDALAMKFRELKLRKNPDCPVCGKHPTITKLIDYNEFCGIRGEEKPVETAVPEMQVEELKRRLDRGRRPFRARCARAARIPDLQHRRTPDSAGRSAEARERTRFQPRDRGALPLRRAQRQGGGFPAAGGIQESAQPGGRNSGLGGSRRSEDAEVLSHSFRSILREAHGRFPFCCSGWLGGTPFAIASRDNRTKVGLSHLS